MNFDHTYITVFGKIMFEPVTFFLNNTIALFCVFAFFSIVKHKSILSKNWAWFFLLIGLSASMGSIAHSVQYQLGDQFIRWVMFSVNSLSLVAIYFCFNAAQNHSTTIKKNKTKIIHSLVICWILILLAVTYIQNNFLLIKIHAGIVLTYSFLVHLISPIKKEQGSSLIASGIFVSFLSIAVHSMKFSISVWFNYKDISHLIMIISLIMIYAGVNIKLRSLLSKELISSIE